MKFISLALVILFLSSPAYAQIDLSGGKEGEVLSQPICTEMTNDSDVSMQGTISTAVQTLKNGDLARHRDNFKLMPGQTREICASGPFFEGRRLELVVRTMIPLFSCKTKIDRKITLTARLDDEGIRRYSANCR